MLHNQYIGVSTLKALLVPYCAQHVPRYHEWMKDPAIQLATASEPLSLEEEFSMQQSWRTDPDKLTFIICKPLQTDSLPSLIQGASFDSDSEMIGDVNLFISVNEGKLEAGEVEIVGELELMIAETNQQRRGFGKAALLTFMYYVLHHEKEIISEFLQAHPKLSRRDSRLSCLTAKIGKDNTRSLSLFEGLGFKKVSEQPNFFDEFELRYEQLDLEEPKTKMESYSIHRYQEIAFQE